MPQYLPWSLDFIAQSQLDEVPGDCLGLLETCLILAIQFGTRCPKIFVSRQQQYNRFRSLHYCFADPIECRTIATEARYASSKTKVVKENYLVVYWGSQVETHVHL
ncbi:hypothetical protein K4K49_012575 [Colletotrichum sp. SAR 10_70]|nr:hypothetical protein K4K50_000384 [Colletotrichum sp. SAR 10_71]KAI8189216.1 hypothetical protein K4K49_012575 [Colletotrichum sp. SAR 10_70]KAI8253136.1 hypothetical protein K4K53_010486 [Colletotrichum sp. SAR 10_77]KAI8262287.1 hypothetical protein K4K58_000662 [Colletotrichum sp. SAR11_239]